MSWFSERFRRNNPEERPPGYHLVFGPVLNGFEGNSMRLLSDKDKERLRGSTKIIFTPSGGNTFSATELIVADATAVRWTDSLVVATYGMTKKGELGQVLAGGIYPWRRNRQIALQNTTTFFSLFSETPDMQRFQTRDQDSATFRMQFSEEERILDVTIGNGVEGATQHEAFDVPQNAAYMDHARLHEFLEGYIHPPAPEA